MQTAQEVRRYLAVLVIAAQQAPDGDVLQLVRGEMHRIVGAICLGLDEHEPTGDGRCRCLRPNCDYVDRVRRALLVPRHELR